MADAAINLEAPPGAPACWGKSWKPTEILCNGGPDPTIFNPVTRSNVRAACNWVASCSKVVNGAAAPPSPLLPAESLRRAVTPTEATSFQKLLNAYQPTIATPFTPPTTTTPIQQPPPPADLTRQLEQERQKNAELMALLRTGATIPQQTTTGGGFAGTYQVPTYLTSVETQGNFVQRAIAESGRAAGKGFFHQLAAFLDRNTLLDLIEKKYQ